MASTTQAVSAYSPDTCMFCHQTLSITVDADTDSESEHPLEREEVIDDVELYCGPSGSGPGGHHAHWTCLVDHAIQTRTRSAVPVFPAVTTCAVCGQNVLHSSGRFIVDVRNEGGETKRFDFGVIIVRSLSSPFFFLPAAPPSSGTTLTRIGHAHPRQFTLPSYPNCFKFGSCTFGPLR